MPDNSNTVQITLQIKDDGTIAIIDQARKKTDDLGETTARASAKAASGLEQLKTGWIKVAAGITAAYVAIKKANDLANMGAMAQQAEESFARVTRSLGIYGDELIRKITQASYTFVDKTDVMLKAQRALVEGLRPDQIIKLTEASRVAARMTGETVEQAFGQTMEAIISLQTRGLKHAFPMDQELVLRRYAESIGTIAEYLTEAGKRQAIYNEIIRQTEERLRTLGDLAPTTAEKIQALNSSFSEFKETAAQTFLETVWSPAFNTMNRIVKEIDTVITRWEVFLKMRKEMSALGKTPGLPPELVPSHETREPELLAGHTPWSKDIKQAEIDYKKLKENQLQLDLEYQGKYLQLTNDRIGQLKIEKAQAIASAKAKGLEISAIEKYYSEAESRIVFESLNITSQKTLKEIAEHAMKTAEIIKANWKASKDSVADYVNALKAANDAMKKLIGEDTTDKFVKNEEEYQKQIRAISPEASDEERRKQVQAAIDNYFKIRKEIEKTKIPVHADVAPMEAEVNESARKLREKGIIIPVTTEGGAESIKYNLGKGWETYTPNWPTAPASEEKPPKTQSEQIYWKWQGENEWKDFINGARQDGDEGIGINIYGIGSTKKPIIEKIREIVDEFGGLEKALQGIEADIKVAELSMEYQKLETKLKQVERILPDLSAIASASGGSPYVGGAIVQTVKDLTAEYTEQMRILQMKMDYQMLTAYRGSYQTGTQYVPETGLYKLHEGEQVLTKNQISVAGSTNNFFIKSVNPRETADEIVQVLKYHLHGELSDFLKIR